MLLTFTTRAADAFINAGINLAVNAKWPRWFVPICNSNPSTVCLYGLAMIPALFTKRLNWS